MEIEDRDRRGGGVTGGEKDTRDEAGGSRGQKEGIGNRGGKEYRKEIAHGGGKRKTGGAEAAGGRPELQKRRIRRRSQGLTA